MLANELINTFYKFGVVYIKNQYRQYKADKIPEYLIKRFYTFEIDEITVSNTNQFCREGKGEKHRLRILLELIDYINLDIQINNLVKDYFRIVIKTNTPTFSRGFYFNHKLTDPKLVEEINTYMSPKLIKYIINKIKEEMLDLV